MADDHGNGVPITLGSIWLLPRVSPWLGGGKSVVSAQVSSVKRKRIHVAKSKQVNANAHGSFRPCHKRCSWIYDRKGTTRPWLAMQESKTFFMLPWGRSFINLINVSTDCVFHDSKFGSPQRNGPCQSPPLRSIRSIDVVARIWNLLAIKPGIKEKSFSSIFIAFQVWISLSIRVDTQVWSGNLV